MYVRTLYKEIYQTNKETDRQTDMRMHCGGSLTLNEQLQQMRTQ